MDVQKTRSMTLLPNTDEYFMRMALAEAHKAAEQDEVPIGAVVVCKNQVIARTHNFTEHLIDFTAHAEMQAFTSATNFLGNKYLNDCTLYVTMEPCVMCAGAAFWTRIGKIVFGAYDERRGYQRLNENVLHPIKQLLFSFLIINFSLSIAFAQNPEVKRTWHWYFGEKNGIDFSSGVPATTTTPLSHEESNASISDTDGNLLFYTNGETIFNANHQPMLNGSGLLGCQSTYRGSIIIPKPGDCNIYYLFNNDCFERLAVSGLTYSEIDMSLDGGLGGVTSNKNIQLFTPNSEILGAVHHENKRDMWVVSVKNKTNDFYAYLVDINGVNTTPVITTIGNIGYIASNSPAENAIANLVFSHNGKKMAVSENFSELGFGATDSLCLYDFDNTAGIISNRVAFAPATDSVFVGIQFSPDSKKLYVNLTNFTDVIYQYDISSNDKATIEASKTFIYQNTLSINGFDMVYGADGKIYIGAYYGVSAPNDYLNVINNPNASGTACDYQTDVLQLNSKMNENLLGVSFVQSYFDSSATIDCSQTLETEENIESALDISVYPNPFTDKATVTLPFESDVQLELSDALGRKIFSENVTGSSYELNRKNLSNGIYFLKIENNNQQIIKKIIIQ